MLTTGPDEPHPDGSRPRPRHGENVPGPLATLGPALALAVSWTVLSAAAWLVLVSATRPASPLTWTTTTLAATAIAAAWLVGIRAAVLLVAATRRSHPSVGRRARIPRPELDDLVVALLYTTADDFRADVVERSMRQTHPRTRTVVLDDSRGAGTRAAVDAVVSRTEAAAGTVGAVQVVRRTDRRGFKAGNINNYLRHHADDVDAVVIIDADQEIGPDFVRTALHHLHAIPQVAVVQGAIRSRRGETRFVRDFRRMFDTHLRAVSAGRARFDMATFAGRGALLDVRALRDVGGLPEVVTEDAALTLELARRGRTVRYVPGLVSVEDAPTDYTAFTTQFGKFTEGAMQLLGRDRGLLFDARLRPARRLDVFLDLVSPLVGAVMLVSLFGFALAAAAERMPGIPVPLGASLGILGSVPLLPEAIRSVRRGGPVTAALFLLRGGLLYASVAIVTLRAVLRVGLGIRARFVVTPKNSDRAGLRTVVRRRRPELAAAAASVLVAVLMTGTVAPAGAFCVVAATAVGYSLVGGRLARS
ncbi:glycosyltransferase family 2 protein [Promicromonospora iranensis]|uniref:Acetolactate synthase regulatory subunit n=1 Tax=Promicromonospora iranensis TaxID=1105144 RepID=A0ABU2CX20_9MICO|nr:glycosyltransferase family 2 protein [Promicromonospora iranensis]MDR7385712.1 acetolactate synthase regulatory subunit [Promicromonospora iranensis]